MKRVALIGAGTGQAQILKGLAGKARVSAVVGITDNGGHTGALRRQLRIPAVGDVRNCITAVAPPGTVWEKLLRYRFTEGELDGMSVGNLMLASLTRSKGSLTRAVESLQDAMRSKGRVIPVADADAQVGVELSNGRRIVGEWAVLKRRDRLPIRRVFHRPRFRASAVARRAVREADRIVLAPGMFYTGVLSCAVAEGLPAAIRRSRGRFIQVLNIMTHPGQTDGMGARAHVEAVTRAVGRAPDVVLVNRGRALPSHLSVYARMKAFPVEDDLGADAVRADLVQRGQPVIGRGKGFESLPHLIRHDPLKVARRLLALR